MYRSPSEKNPLIRESYAELIKLCRFYGHFGAPTVIGGWAVYFYNPYFGSVDIDLVSPSFKGSFSEIIERYERTFGYEIVNVDSLGLQVIARKPVKHGESLAGYVEIDACTTGDTRASRFHEDETKELPYSLCFDSRYRRDLELENRTHCYVPCKSLLLLYKVKASRDRTHDLKTRGATLSGERVAWLRDKIVKDKADIIALLDPAPKDSHLVERVEASSVKEIIQATHTEFALSTLGEIARDEAAMRLYSPVMKQAEVKGWLRKAMETLGVD